MKSLISVYTMQQNLKLCLAPSSLIHIVHRYFSYQQESSVKCCTLEFITNFSSGYKWWPYSLKLHQGSILQALCNQNWGAVL